MNRRTFIIAATLPTLFQSCRPEQAMGQERDLTIGERIQIVDAAIRRCVLPDGWTVEEWNGSHIFAISGETLTPSVAAYALQLHWHVNQFAGTVYTIGADQMLRDAHLPGIDQLVERTLLDAVERFALEAQ